MEYAAFLVLFVVGPTVALLTVASVRRSVGRPRALVGVALMVGAALVYLLLDTTDTSDAAAFAVVAGTAATLVFNAFRVVAARVLGVEIVGSGAGALAAAGAGAEIAAVLRLVGLLAVLFASPVGYAVGGAVGAWLNGRDGGDEEESGPADDFEPI